MQRLVYLGLVALTIGAATVSAGAVQYSGSLLYEDNGATDTGLTVLSGNTDGWFLYTQISWLVSNEESAPTGYPWYYEYTITVHKYELSHLVLETSASFTNANIADVEVNDSSHSQYGVGTQPANAGSPDQPEDLYGIKFDDLGGGFDAEGKNVTHVISFFSDRDPVWGDAYMKCGGFGNQAWNDGFTVSDADPVAPASDGSLSAHLLIPDSVPEPATMTLLGLGGAALLAVRKRRK